MQGDPKGGGDSSGKDGSGAATPVRGAASPRKPPASSPTPRRGDVKSPPPTTAAAVARSPRVIHVRQAQVAPDPESGFIIRRDPRYEDAFYTTVPVGGQPGPTVMVVQFTTPDLCLDDVSDEHISILNASRSVKFLALLNIIFGIVWGASLLLLFLFIWLPLAGFFGARLLKPGLLMVYCVYLALEVAGRAYLVAHPGQYQRDTTGLRIFNVIALVVSVFILMLVARFTYQVARLPKSDRHRLREILQYTSSVWC